MAAVVNIIRVSDINLSTNQKFYEIFGCSFERKITKIYISFLMKCQDFERVNRRSKKIANLIQTDAFTDDDYSELLLPQPERPKLRNTDKSMYLCSRKKCPLCHKYYRRIVPHFKSQHKESEVFFSRISPKMVEYIKNGKRSFIQSSASSNHSLQTLCVFCEEEKNFPVHYWTDHVRR